MIPVYQDIFYKEHEDGTTTRGNCYVACIASILEFPLYAVPQFQLLYGKSNWRVHLHHWLSYYDKELNEYHQEPGYGGTENDKYYIVSGRSPRYNNQINHSCIWYRGQVVHDPHPEGGGVVKPYKWALITDTWRYHE